MPEQAGSVFQTAWCYTKLAAGGFLVLFALFLLRPDGEYIEQMQRLEYEGHNVTAKLVDKIEGSALKGMPPTGGGAAGSFARGFAAGQRLSGASEGRGGSQADQDTGQLFYLEFEFKTPKGEQIKDRGIVSAKQFDKVRVGAELEVIYLPENPAINRLVAYSEPFKRMPQSILLTFSIIVGSIGAFLIWWSWPSGATDATEVADGDVLDRVRGNGRVARRPVVASGEPVTRRAQPQSARRRQGFGQRA